TRWPAPMKSRIKTKSAFIVAITLICIYGIIGFPRSRNELNANLKKNVRLGLDLSGGTQLVMEVELQDAFKAFADDAINGLKIELDKEKIGYTSINRNDRQTLRDADKIEVDIKGAPLDQRSTLRR